MAKRELFFLNNQKKEKGERKFFLSFFSRAFFHFFLFKQFDKQN